MVEFESLIRSGKPNDYLVLPIQHVRPNQDIDAPSPVFEESPEILFERILQIVDQTPGWTLKASNPDTRKVSFFATTPLLRFKDDVDIAIYAGPSTGQAEIAIYSRSRIGYSDFGANRRRVRALLGFL